jgi:hypothetical protein
LNIFDGELLLDKGTKMPRFLVFDALFVRRPIMNMRFGDRVSQASLEIRNRYRRAEVIQK